MKRALLGTTALLSAGLGAAPALAEEPIRLSVGGFFREAYMVVADDETEGLGDDRAGTGFFGDAEVHFVGRTTLDNGLEIGARIELEGENSNDQIDEAWI